MDIIIDELTEYSPEIADALIVLVRQLDDHYQRLTEQDIRYMIQSPNTHLLLARLKESNIIVGMATLIVYRIPYKMKGWLEDVVVDESYRQHGIGSQLIGHAIEKAQQLGVKSLNLTSNSKRDAANELYQRLGFKKRDTNVYRINLN